LRLLLDTHVIIWMVNAPEKLPKHVRGGISEADEVAVSVISAWEYGIKRAKRRSEAQLSFEELLADISVERLAFSFPCHVHAETLPPIHGDPFDRMLIAQALHHGLTLVTADETIRRYPVQTLW
jgi:PIN domain nuclease of toxin-antitoxin system